MTLKEFIRRIQEMADANPEILDYTVIYSSDDEDNSFQEVWCNASVGYYEDGEFVQLENSEDFEDRELTKEDVNAICIN